MPKKILVTGAAGFVGRHLTHALLKQGHLVVAVDNLVPLTGAKDPSKGWPFYVPFDFSNFVFHRADCLSVVDSQIPVEIRSVVPDVHIPDDVLPADERLNPQALAAESQELSRYVLPAALPVGRGYADALLEEVEGSAPPPAGIRALFPE